MMLRELFFLINKQRGFNALVELLKKRRRLMNGDHN